MSEPLLTDEDINLWVWQNETRVQTARGKLMVLSSDRVRMLLRRMRDQYEKERRSTDEQS